MTAHDEMIDKFETFIVMMRARAAPRLDLPFEDQGETGGTTHDPYGHSSGTGQTNEIPAQMEDHTVDQVSELRDMIRNAMHREGYWESGNRGNHEVNELPPESQTEGLTFPDDCWRVSLEQMVTCLLCVVGQETANVARDCRTALDYMTILDEIRDSQIVRGNLRFPDSSIFPQQR